MTKFVYTFGGKTAEGKADMKNLLGGKGANLAEMCLLGLPVPAGLTITTECCTAYYENNCQLPAGLMDDVSKAAFEIQHGNYDVSLPSEIKEQEVYELVSSFKEMAQKLEQLELTRTELLAGVTHELKTPVTSISGLLQAVKDGVVKDHEATEFINMALTETTNHEGILYGYMSCEKFKKVDVLLNGKSIIDITDENGYQCNTLELGKHNINEQVELEFLLLEKEIQPKEIMFYTLDLEKFKNAINLLNKEKLEIIEYNKDYIKATINVENDNVLYTSIPYDKGFKIIVDGKEQNPEKTFDALISLKLEKGKHTIEFKYQSRGLKEGTIISLIGLLLFIITKKKER